MGMFLITVSMHATRKTSFLLALYVAQSVLVAGLFLVSAVTFGGTYLYVIAIVTLLTKAVLIPILFSRLLRRVFAKGASDTYLNTPVTLSVLVLIALFSFSAMHLSIPHAQFSTIQTALGFAPLHLAGILAALFLAVNRKEAFSQIIALLALENWVVFVATLAGFHQTLAVELAVTLEIVALIVIAITFMAMVFERFGSLDISRMTHLSERDE